MNHKKTTFGAEKVTDILKLLATGHSSGLISPNGESIFDAYQRTYNEQIDKDIYTLLPKTSDT